MKTYTITFRATKAEADALNNYCTKEGQTVSEAIRALIGENLFNHASNAPINKKETGDFSNNQNFKVGQEVEFYCLPTSGDKFAGIHTVKKIRYDKTNDVWGIQTDISQRVAEPKDLFIAVHWFRPWNGKPQNTGGKIKK